MNWLGTIAATSSAARDSFAEIPVDLVAWCLYSIYSMKYKLFVVAGTAVMEIAASNEFNDFNTLIEQLDLFGNEWDVTDYGETVLSSDQWPL